MQLIRNQILKKVKVLNLEMKLRPLKKRQLLNQEMETQARGGERWSDQQRTHIFLGTSLFC